MPCRLVGRVRSSGASYPSNRGSGMEREPFALYRSTRRPLQALENLLQASALAHELQSLQS
jgi:hypothetical protein